VSFAIITLCVAPQRVFVVVVVVVVVYFVIDSVRKLFRHLRMEASTGTVILLISECLILSPLYS
jgi:hypothetical protein